MSTRDIIQAAAGVPTGPNLALYAWGRNSDGRLGDGTDVNRSSPIQIGALTDWEQLAGGGTSLAIKNDGTLWIWGDGDGMADNTTVSKSSPIQVGALTNWSKISVGSSNCYAITTGNVLYAWGGANSFGDLGQNNTARRSSPTQIGSADWASVSGGNSYALAVKTNGTLWAWGGSFTPRGALGDNTTINRSSPVQIGALSDWAQVSAGANTSCAIKTNGTLWVWGDDAAGGLGLNSLNVHRSSPVQVGALSDWAQVSSTRFTGGSPWAMAIKTNGTLWGWGFNGSGNLGISSTTNRSSPVQVGALSNWAQVSTSGEFAIAIKTDGTIWFWGRADDGQSGLPTGGVPNFFRSSPVQIGALNTWTTCATGSQCVLALLEE